MTEIAHGEINIDLNDAGALAGLRRVEAEYEAAMARIDRMEAEASVGADISQLEADLRRAKDQVRILEGQRATVEIDGDADELNKAIAAARAEVRRLDGEKATIEIETRGSRQAIADIEKVRAAEASRAAAEDRYARQRQRIAQQEERNRALAERAAMRESEIRRRADLDAAKEREQVEKLTQQWVRYSKEVEKSRTRRTPLGAEARAEAQAAERFARARLERVEQELRHFGADVPPAHMRVDVDERWLRRTRFRLTQFAANVGDKLSNIGHVRLNVGPISGTLRTITIAAGILSPILTSLLGSATALVGVLGTGLTGASAIAAGTFTGLALNLGGVAGAIHPILTDFKLAKQVTDAYSKAVDKYGASSKQAKTAQEQMNHVLKAVDPNAAAAAKGITQVADRWHKLTGDAASKAFGDVLTQGLKTANALLPTLARNTNQTFDILDTKLSGFAKGLRSADAVNVFDSLGKSANKFLGPALDGVGHLAAAFGHVAEAAARLFSGRAGQGFNNWARSLDRATQPGAKLDATIQRLGDHAADLLHFFASLGRLMATVLNGGADSGDRLVNSMSDALERWNEFLKTPQGAQSMAEFFARSEANVRALWSALAPLIASFVQWASLLAPFTTGLLKGVTAVANLVAGFTRLVGLTGPLGALGATLGVVFAVSKIGAFVGAIARAVGAIRGLVAAEGALAAVKAIATGSLLTSAAGGVAAGGAAAAAGGAAATAARTAAAATAVEGLATAEVAAAGAAGGLGLGLSTLATGGLALVAAGAIYGGYKLLTMKSAADKLRDSIKETTAETAQYREVTHALADVSSEAGAATGTYRQELGRVSTVKQRLNKLEADGKKGTVEYTNTLADLNQHLAARQTAEQQSHRLRQQQTILMGRQMDATLHLGDAEDDVSKALKERDHWQGIVDSYGGRSDHEKEIPLKKLAEAQSVLNKAQSAYADRLDAAKAAEQQAIVNTINYQRALHGLIPIAGSAAAAITRLAKTAPNLAKSIAGKFPDPADVGRVAGAASAALRTGSSRSITTRIVADSKSADEAIRRLNAARITPKKLQIIQSGGQEAIRVLSNLAGRKLTPKEQRIAQKGGQGVLALLTRILAHRLPPKTQHTNEVGSERVLGSLSRVQAYKLSDKRFTVWLQDQASARLGSIIASLASIHDKSVTVSVRQSVIRLAGHDEGTARRASGLPMGRAAHEALVGEGAAPEWRVNTSRGLIQKVMAPAFMRLGPEDAIIPTEPRYRDRGRDIFKSIARDLGLPEFAKGKKKDPPLSDKRRNQVKRDARKRVTEVRKKSPRKLELRAYDHVEKLETEQDNKNREITRAEGQLSQPESFITKTGKTDVLGNPLYTVDAGAVKNWSDQLTHMKTLYDQLIDIITRLAKAITDALAAIQNVYEVADANAKRFQSMKSAAANTMVHGGSKAERQAAKERWSIYDAEYDRQIRLKRDAADDKKTYKEKERILSWDWVDATDQEQKYAKDAAAVAGEAGKEQAAYDESIKLPELPYSPADLAIAKAESEGDIAGQVAGYNAKIAEAQALLSDANPYNDVEAYNTITSAKSAIQGLQESGSAGSGGAGGADAGPNFAAQSMALSAARADLYKSMGSNYAPVWAQSAPSGPRAGSGLGAFGMASAGGGNTVNLQVNNTFPTPPPDPHTWSQGIGWELQAAI